MRKRPVDPPVVPMNARRIAPRPATPDPRARRTRRLLSEALLELLREKDFDALSVQDITTRAHLHRGTFYLHFRDKEALLTQTMKDVLAEFEQVHHREAASPWSPTTPESFLLWFRHVADHAKFYRLMLGPEGPARFTAQVRRDLERLMTPHIEENLPGDRSGIPPAPRGRFLASAFLGVMAWWLEHEPRQSPEQMASWLWTLTATMRWSEAG